MSAKRDGIPVSVYTEQPQTSTHEFGQCSEGKIVINRGGYFDHIRE